MHVVANQAEVEQALAEMAALVAQRFKPLRILLFGSRARGTAIADSDTDLLVVMPDAAFHRELAVEMRRALQKFPLPFDLLVIPESVMARKSVVRGTVYFEAAAEGRVLYAAD